MFPYDQVAYPSLAHPRTHPDHLGVKALLWGLEPAAAANCRYLELGCGDATNLAFIAAQHPGSRFVGLDLSEKAIERGRHLCTGLGLTNVELHVADLGEIPGVPGEFDFVAAHGLYSWVPEPVRRSLLGLIRSALAPQGVAYVSYLVLPGAGLREMVRGILRRHAARFEDPVERVEQAVAFLHYLSQAKQQQGLYQALLAQEVQHLQGRPPGGVWHDELSEHSAPCFFEDFVAAAGEFGLQFLSEAEYAIPSPSGITSTARQIANHLGSNRIAREQQFDYLEGRRFRQTLLCRDDVERAEALQMDPIRSFHLACRLPAHNPETALTSAAPAVFGTPALGRIEIEPPLAKAAFLVLHERWPRTVPFDELVALAAARLGHSGPVAEGDQRRLAEILVQVHVPKGVEFFRSPFLPRTDVPERPEVFPLARALAARGDDAINLRGTPVQFEEPLAQAILPFCNGSRTAAEITAAAQGAGTHITLDQVRTLLATFAQGSLLV